MLQISWFEFIVRGIPEGFLFIFAAHAFSKTGIKLNKYLLSCVLYCIIVYLIRLLPIQYGVHTILNLIILIILLSCINNIDIIKSIQAGIITFILGFISDGIVVSFIQFILKKDLEILLKNPTLKTLYGLPSVLILGIVAAVFYIRLSKRKEFKYV
jgi:hypothetical protein